MNNTTPPKGCKYIAIMLVVFALFCTGLGFYTLLRILYGVVIR
ncbi:hypothetical protein AB406_0479 [Riemerella anatipestifer]|nr:hypothetical protein AB406_0479 [Riemerella anatipestifer]